MVMDFLGKFNLNWLSTVLTPALPPFWRGSGLPLFLHFSTGFYKIYLIQLSNFGWRRNHRGTAKTIATAYSSPFKHKKSTALKSRDHIRKKTALHKALAAAAANFTYSVWKHQSINSATFIWIAMPGSLLVQPFDVSHGTWHIIFHQNLHQNLNYQASTEKKTWQKLW